MDKLVLIDGHSILNRAFYGVPLLTNAAGLHTNAVYGFLNIMFKILDEEKPQYLAVAFDVKEKNDILKSIIEKVEYHKTIRNNRWNTASDDLQLKIFLKI